MSKVPLRQSSAGRCSLKGVGQKYGRWRHGAHATTVGGRVMINASSEPVSNWIASFLGDVLVEKGLLLAVFKPKIFFVISGFFLLFAMICFYSQQQKVLLLKHSSYEISPQHNLLQIHLLEV